MDDKHWTVLIQLFATHTIKHTERDGIEIFTKWDTYNKSCLIILFTVILKMHEPRNNKVTF